jgi:hypothetical protein
MLDIRQQPASLSYRFNRMLQLTGDRRIRRFRSWHTTKAALLDKHGSYRDCDPFRLSSIIHDLPEKVELIFSSAPPPPPPS